jgi:hyperosmotically inducible protein
VKLAKEVDGVKSVKDHFLPKKKGDACGTTDNLKLVAKITAGLIEDKELSSTTIEVKAVQCNVVLLGLVGSKKEISKAIAHAKGVEGVRSVTSYLKVAK